MQLLWDFTLYKPLKYLWKIMKGKKVNPFLAYLTFKFQRTGNKHNIILFGLMMSWALCQLECKQWEQSQAYYVKFDCVMTGIVVRKEKPELEEQKDNLTLNIAAGKKKLQELEDEILRSVITSKPSHSEWDLRQSFGNALWAYIFLWSCKKLLCSWQGIFCTCI